MKNPYRPGVGLSPTYLAGREREQRRFALTLDAAPEIPANVRLTGLRGVGKSVLLARLSDIADREAEWAATMVELQPRHNSDRGLLDLMHAQLSALRRELSAAERLKSRIGKVTRVSRSVIRADYEDVTWSVDGQVAGDAADLGRDLLETVDVALRSGRNGLIVLLDEAQVLSDSKHASGDHPLSTLLSAFSTLQKRGAPIALVLCGLPTLTINLLAARTYSERMFKGEEVDALARDDAREALVKPLEGTGRTADETFIERVLHEVDGYPYFIQLWGAEVWDSGTTAREDRMTVPLLEASEDEIHRRLDLDFYEPRVASLTPAEQDLLLVSSRCSYPPLVVSELVERSTKSSSNVNVLLGRLVKENVLFRVRQGQYRYTAPGFHDFLQRYRVKL